MSQPYTPLATVDVPCDLCGTQAIVLVERPDCYARARLCSADFLALGSLPSGTACTWIRPSWATARTVATDRAAAVVSKGVLS